MVAFNPTFHPVLEVPTLEELESLGEEKAIEVLNRREEIIRKEKENPLTHGWEPPIWRICDAMMGFEWVDESYINALHRSLIKHSSVDLEQKTVSVLLIQGGNRAGKSEWAAKRIVKILLGGPNRRVWCFHKNEQNSITYQQSLIFKYLPPELRARKIKSSVAYVSYSKKNGFTDNKFVLPNGSECEFRFYGQEDDAVEGGNVDAIWCDELVPPDWIDTLRLRIAERNGKMIITFTPVKGYTQTVKMFLDGSNPILESTAFLCPKDDQGMRPDLALNMEGGDYESEALCHPDRLDNLLTDSPFQAEVPEGRKFESVPRIVQPQNPDDRVVYFHSSDNPFGNPKRIIKTIAQQSTFFIKERFYGVAHKTVSSRFPKFDLRVHTIADAAIPEHGTNYMILDPCSGRNFFFIYLRIAPNGRRYVYREWPGYYDVPFIGVPGAWCVPDGKKHDGKPGPAQETFGFGLIQYKMEFARLEGWKALEDQDGKIEQLREGVTESEWVESISDQDGAKEVVFDRYIDSRFASAPTLDNDRPITLLEKFSELGIYFQPTPGEQINEGVQLINDQLDYDTERPLDDENCPTLYVAKSCKNVIYALQNWTGADGHKGACKDPIDVLRYQAQLDLSYSDSESWSTEGGGHY